MMSWVIGRESPREGKSHMHTGTFDRACCVLRPESAGPGGGWREDQLRSSSIMHFAGHTLMLRSWVGN